MARVALYGRNSGDAQEKAETIETQRRLLMEWAAKEGHEVVGWYADEGVQSSVPVADRDEGGRLLRDAARRRFELVVCYKLSRWSRIPEVWKVGRQALRRHGVELGCLHDDTRDRTPGERFSLGVRLLVGEYERDNIEQQCLDGRYSWVQEGYYPGGVVPYGYRVIPDPAPRADKKRRSILVHDPDEAEVVRLLFLWCVEEGLSCPLIARRLTDRGIPRSSEGGQPDRHRIARAKTYDRWSKDTVLLILRNPRYKGAGVFGGGRRCVNGREQVSWPFPPIVTAAVWEAAQVQVSRNRKESPRNCRRTYLLRGLVHCTHCIRRMVGHTVARGERSYAYYYCPGPLGPGMPCPLPYVPLAPLEGDLWATLVPLVQRREETVARLRAQATEGERRLFGLQASCDGLRGAIEKKRRQAERALAMHLEETITREEFMAQRERLIGETERLQAELDRQQAELAGCRLREDRLEGVADWLARWQEDVAHASPAGQRRVIEQMVERVELAMGAEAVVVRYVFCLDPGTESAAEGVPLAPDTSPCIRRKRNAFLFTLPGALMLRRAG